jgi:hypothetical protein
MTFRVFEMVHQHDSSHPNRYLASASCATSTWFMSGRTLAVGAPQLGRMAFPQVESALFPERQSAPCWVQQLFRPTRFTTTLVYHLLTILCG